MLAKDGEGHDFQSCRTAERKREPDLQPRDKWDSRPPLSTGQSPVLVIVAVTRVGRTLLSLAVDAALEARSSRGALRRSALRARSMLTTDHPKSMLRIPHFASGSRLRRH